MPKDVGVIVIHGMGSQGRTKPDDSAVPTYSKTMHKRVARELGVKMDRVAWREVFFAHILQDRQEAFLRAIKRRTDFDKLRGFVMCNLSDAASYRKTNDPNDTTYEMIHAQIDAVMAELRADLGPNAPVVILAHSLGGHIMSNFIYDQQAIKRSTGQGRFAEPIRNMETVAGLITFGCNIPVFVFAYPPDRVFPIDRPNAGLPPQLKFKTWWYNLYDRDDVLGYPLRDIGPLYADLVRVKELRDVPVNAGGLLTSWNPASHNAYWGDPDVYEPVSRFLQNMMRGVDAAGI